MDCDHIKEIMTAYIVDKVLGKAMVQPPEKAISHFSACLSCKKEMDVMLRIVTGKDYHLSRPLTCSEMSDRMPEMIEKENEAMPEAYPAEWLHLQTCQDCRAIFEIIGSCMTKENMVTFEHILRSVQHVHAEKHEVWGIITPLIRRLSQELNILVSKGKEALNQIPEWLGTATFIPLSTAVFRGSGDSGDFLQVLTIPDLDLNRQIVVQTQATSPEGIHVKMKLEDIGKNTAIGGVIVALLDADGRFLTQLVTTDGGQGFVDFQDLQPGNYKIKITELHQSWELSMRLS